MKTCQSCRAEVPPQVAVCPFCGARFTDAPPRPGASVDEAAEAGGQGPELPPPRQDSHLLKLPPAPMIVMGGAPARAARRRRGLWMLVPVVLAVAGAIYAIRARGVALPVDGLEAVASDDVLPCGDAPTCVLVYLAPWDEASRRTADRLDDLRAAWAEDGPALVVVVGPGEGDTALRMARALAGSTWIDPDGALPDALGFETVPVWLRVDAGRVVRRVDGTYLPLARQLEALGLPAAAPDVEDERRVLTGEPARQPSPAGAVDDTAASSADEPADDAADAMP